MSVVEWLNGEAFTLFGQHVIWSDMIGNIAGLGALVLGWRRSVLTWPVQLMAGVVLIVAFASADLAGGVGKQLIVIAVAMWGWRQWRGNGGTEQAQDGAVAVRFADWRERGVLLVGTAAGTLAVGGVFSLVPSLSWNPWPDAYIFVGTVVAMYAQARGMVEFWFAWLLVDAVGVPLNFANGFAFSGFVYVLYGALVLWGLRDWWLRSRRSTRPVLEGATA